MVISAELDPDIILIDAGLEGYSPDFARDVKGNGKVVMLMPPGTGEQAILDIQSGVKGYLSVNQTSQEFIQALRIIARGDIVIAREAVEPLKRNNTAVPLSQPKDNLTDREMEVLGLLGKGMTNLEGGRELYVSEHTVKYTLHVLNKLNLRNRQQVGLCPAWKLKGRSIWKKLTRPPPDNIPYSIQRTGISTRNNPSVNPRSRQTIIKIMLPSL